MSVGCVLWCDKCGSEDLFFEVWLYQCVVLLVNFIKNGWKSVCVYWEGRRGWGGEMLCDVWCVWQSVSLIAIIVVFVITAEGRETPQTDSIWEKYLGTCIHPHLETKTEKERVEKDKGGLRRMCVWYLNLTDSIVSDNLTLHFYHRRSNRFGYVMLRGSN